MHGGMQKSASWLFERSVTMCKVHHAMPMPASPSFFDSTGSSTHNVLSSVTDAVCKFVVAMHAVCTPFLCLLEN